MKKEYWIIGIHEVYINIRTNVKNCFAVDKTTRHSFDTLLEAEEYLLENSDALFQHSDFSRAAIALSIKEVYVKVKKYNYENRIIRINT